MRIIFTITILLSCNLLISQSYHPLLSEDKTWDIFYWEHECFWEYCAGQRQFIEGDTLIDGTIYQIVWLETIIPLNTPEEVFVPPYGLSGNVGIAGFMREDTNARKVYTRGVNEDDMEILTYDFSLEQGDSLFMPYLDPDYFYLDTIINVPLTSGGTTRKFVFSGMELSNGNDFYIEGVGGASTLLFPFDHNFEFGADIMCVSFSETVFYDFGGCTGLLTTIDRPVVRALKIVPNPASSKLQIPVERGSFTIYNRSGALIKKGTLNGGNLLINDLRAGWYLIQVKTNDEIWAGKFVKF